MKKQIWSSDTSPVWSWHYSVLHWSQRKQAELIYLAVEILANCLLLRFFYRAAAAAAADICCRALLTLSTSAALLHALSHNRMGFYRNSALFLYSSVRYQPGLPLQSYSLPRLGYWMSSPWRWPFWLACRCQIDFKISGATFTAVNVGGLNLDLQM